MTVKWTPPESDGGAPITNYIVEQSERFSPRWNRVNEDTVTSCEFTVENLPEGSTYQFRICAENKGGVGKPSAPTDPRGVASEFNFFFFF